MPKRIHPSMSLLGLLLAVVLAVFVESSSSSSANLRSRSLNDNDADPPVVFGPSGRRGSKDKPQPEVEGDPNLFQPDETNSLLDPSGRRGSKDKNDINPPEDDSSRKSMMRNGLDLLPSTSSSSTTTTTEPAGDTPNNVMTDQNIQQAVDIWCDNPTLGLKYFGPLNEWNTTAVTSFRGLFRRKKDFNDDGCSQWDTSRVTSMAAMFEGAHAFDQDLSQWDTAQVVSMSAMFASASSFTGTKNGNSLSQWNVEKVARMDRMFQDAFLFQGDLSGWKTSKVHHVANMFTNALNYKGGQDLANWQTREFVDMTGMFQHAVKFQGNISLWDTSNAVEMDDMFADAHAFDGDLSAWNTSKVITMARMFQNARQFTGSKKSSSIQGWNVETVRNFYGMFENTPVFDADISSWKPVGAKNMEHMFFNASGFGTKPNSLPATITESTTQGDFKLLCWQLSNGQVKTSNMFCGSSVRFDPCCATPTQLEISCCNRFCYNTSTTCAHPNHDHNQAHQYVASSGNLAHEEIPTGHPHHDLVLAAEGHAKDNFVDTPAEDSFIGWEGIVMIVVLLLVMMLCFLALVYFL
ncbi:Mycoplasma protein of unknown function, DUF285 [Seminavis robusta]|uniref:Uncharacterized protein n=1 Tax=Seminavis robusta TaxID=568900 RepID=A0A9N8DLK3_9STRA|nr:Mycoplasma protein of unknown function, DUF285 [Seminavis robusta]|eukprot:Sro222_g091240.1 Mycoplasma protein of unknown function, DUF285 (578) ;mRNA; f:69399-71397